MTIGTGHESDLLHVLVVRTSLLTKDEQIPLLVQFGLSFSGHVELDTQVLTEADVAEQRHERSFELKVVVLPLILFLVGMHVVLAEAVRLKLVLRNTLDGPLLFALDQQFLRIVLKSQDLLLDVGLVDHLERLDGICR